MIKRKLLITAASAVLFGCIIFAAVHMSRMNNSHHTGDSDVISTTHVSENVVIDSVTESSAQVNAKPIDNTTEETTKEEQPSSRPITETVTTVPVTPENTTVLSESTTTGNTTASTFHTQPDTQAPSVDINSEDNTQFSFSKIIVDDPDLDYYTKLVKDKGYKDIRTVEELAEYCTGLLTLKEGKKQVKYIITEKGLFDEIANSMDQLKKAAEENPVISNIDRRDRYLFDTLGLDYQQYYSNGVGLFMFKKIQDIENNAGSHSVYAVYFYSYTTAEQNELLRAVIDEAVGSFAGTDYDKVLAAHEYLRNHTDYSDSGTYLVHAAYGALVNKESVCEGYAKAYKLLLNAMGIECDVVINAGHAWNTVCLDGQWYLVDVTNNDAEGKLTYFLLGQDVLLGDGEIAQYFGYNDKSNTDIHIPAEFSYGREM